MITTTSNWILQSINNTEKGGKEVKLVIVPPCGDNEFKLIFKFSLQKQTIIYFTKLSGLGMINK